MRSLHGAYVRFPATAFGDNRPVDVSYARDCIANNAAHIADEAGQVRINFVHIAGAYYQGATDSVDYQPINPTFGPFPLSIKSDGGSYNLVVRVRGFLDGAGSVNVRAVLSKKGDAPSVVNGTVQTQYTSQNCTSTTDAWLTATDDYCLLSATSVAAASSQWNIPNAAGDESIYTTQVCVAYLTVFSKGSAGFRLTGLYAREYIGT